MPKQITLKKIFYKGAPCEHLFLGEDEFQIWIFWVFLNSFGSITMYMCGICLPGNGIISSNDKQNNVLWSEINQMPFLCLHQGLRYQAKVSLETSFFHDKGLDTMKFACRTMPRSRLSVSVHVMKEVQKKVMLW